MEIDLITVPFIIRAMMNTGQSAIYFYVDIDIQHLRSNGD
jgi:hypothetical protein